MDYRILGPLEASDGERPIALGSEKQRALLAVLLLHAGEVVSADQLIDDLWGERPPAAAHNALQVHVSRLRKALEANGRGEPQTNEEGSGPSSGGVLITRGRGYLLRVEPGELDLDRFRVLVEEGRQALAAGDAPRAAETLRAGLELWRGPPLADFTYEPFAEAPITELEELRLGALEDRVEADLALGRGQELIGELTTLVAQNPLRERLRGQLMLALYRCGRQAEALDVYQEFRRGLAEELGLDPSPGLRQLHAAILQRDPALEPRARGGGADAVDDGNAGVGTGPGAPVLKGRAGGFRTFLLADIRGYSSFAASRGDEAAAALTERFAAIAETVVTQFGGVNIGTRGDEVLIAFESPRQAVRAAVAFEQALLEGTQEDPSLPLPAGVGLDVGEAVIVSDGWRANAINVAARLCSLAKGGEVLATREVTHLAQAIEGVRYLPLPPVRLKGIPGAVAPIRILADAGDPARGFAELGLTRAAAPPDQVADGAAGRASVLEVCPFKGLAFFDRADAEYFCGRERLVTDLLARLVESTLVGILGPSGIGKSSLLRAGVLPALSAGALPGSASWRQLLLRPGEHPSAELGRALDGEPLARVLERLSPSERIVVAVDQLEELFTVCDLEEERAAFLEQLVEAARDGERRALVVCALRADFYGRLASFPAFAELLSASHVLVAPMGRDELARAIEQPAVRAGFEVERALVDALVSDVAGEPGGLPLLSTTLLELWRTHDDGALRYQRYRASGGVRGAVARLAEATYDQLDDAEQRIARGLMLRLAGDQEGVLVRRRVPHAELVRQDGAEPVLAALIAARLLTVNDGEVELSHEALLREWPRYQTWLDEDRAGRRLHAHLTTSAREWDTKGGDPGDLYRGARLSSTLEWAAQHEHELNLPERRFLDASRRHAARATRRLYGVLVGVGLLLALASVAAAIALISRGQAVSAQAVAKSRALAVESQAELSADPELSILLAIQAARTSATPQAMYALREAIDQSPLRRQLPARGDQGCADLGFDEASPALAYSPSGGRIAEVACDGRVVILDDATGHVRTRWDGGGPADAVAFSPDGRTLAVAAQSGITLLNAATGTVQRTLSPVSNKPQCAGVPNFVTCSAATASPPPYCVAGRVNFVGAIPAELAFSPDGTRLAVSYDFNLDVWQLHGSPFPRVVSGVNGCIEGMGFSRSGAEIFAADNADVDVIDAASGRLLGVHALRGDSRAGPFYPVVGRLAVSPNGRYVAAATGLDARKSGEVELFDAAPWRHLATLAYSADVPITAVAFSPDSSRLAIGAGDGRAGIWSVASGQELLALSGHTTQISSIAWRPDGGELATASADGKGLVWRGSLSQGTTIATGAGIALSAANTRGDRVWGAFASPSPGSDVLRSWTTAGAPLERFAVPGPQSGDAAGIGENTRFGILVDENQNLVIRDLANGRTIGTVSQGVPVTGLSLAGDRLAVGSSTGAVVLYDVAPGMPPLAAGSVSGGTCGGAYVAISADRQRAAAVGQCGDGILWNARTGRPLQAFNTGVQPVSGVSLSPDGQLLAVSSVTRITTLFDLATKRALHVLTGDTAPVTGVAFSPRGTWLATASDDGDVRIWDPTSGQLMRVLPEGASVTSVAFTPGGQDVVSTDSLGRIHIQDACSLCGNASALLHLAATRIATR